MLAFCSDPKAQRTLPSDDGLTAVLSPYPPVSKLIEHAKYCDIDFVTGFVTPDPPQSCALSGLFLMYQKGSFV
jgi:hypothetical protein